MDKDQKDKLVPSKIEGKNNEVEESINCTSRQEALKKFNSAADKLLNINSWQRIAETSSASAEFQIMDESGHSPNEIPKEGNYIQIDIPGPGPKSGDGFDWVRIEKIINERNPKAENEFVGFKVRACSDPRKNGVETAHFFTDDATSTFIIERKGETIFSKYFGRNELINSNTNTQDKIRNTLIGAAAKLGFSEIQWKSLIKGFLK